MDSSSYLDAVNKMLEPFASNPALRLQHSDLKYRGSPDPGATGADVEESIQAFYSAVESFRFQWTIAPGAEASLGEAATNDVIGGAANFLPWTDAGNIPADELEEASQAAGAQGPAALQPVEYLAGDKLVFFVREPDGGVRDSLLLYDFNAPGRAHPIPVGVTAYFHKGLSLWFFYGWQAAAFLGDVEQQEKVSRYLKSLFPPPAG